MINKLSLCIYFTLLMLVCLYAYKRPEYNWDMLPYMAIALQHDMHDPKAIHDSVYALAGRMVPSPEFRELTDGGLAYRRKMAGNAWEFQSQLPYYVVKPLYTRQVYYFYRAENGWECLGIPKPASLLRCKTPLHPPGLLFLPCRFFVDKSDRAALCHFLFFNWMFPLSLDKKVPGYSFFSSYLRLVHGFIAHAGNRQVVRSGRTFCFAAFGFAVFPG
jgi:hypothetical protein